MDDENYYDGNIRMITDEEAIELFDLLEIDDQLCVSALTDVEADKLFELLGFSEENEDCKVYSMGTKKSQKN